MLSDYEKIEFLREHQYFDTDVISEVIKHIKFQCMRYLVQDGNIGLDGYAFDDYLQPWIDVGFKDEDFDEFLKEQSKDDHSYHEYKNIYNRVAKFLNQKVAKPKDTKATYFFTQTSKVKFEHTAYRLIKQAIVDLTNINYEALCTQSIEEYKLLLLYKKCEIPEEFKRLKLKETLKDIYNKSNDSMNLHDFEKYLEFPSIVLHEKLFENKTLKKTLFIEGVSGSGKTVLAQRVAFEVSPENSFYIDFENEINCTLMHNNKENFIDFISSVKNANGIIILDNIQLCKINDFLLECEKILLKIIVIAKIDSDSKKNYIENSFFERFIKDRRLKHIEEKAHFIGFPYNDTQKAILFLIYDMFIYYKNKKKLSQNIDASLLDKTEEIFGTQLLYLKYAIENSYDKTEGYYDIKNLNINSAKSHILHKYKKFINLDTCKEFKFLFSLKATIKNFYYVKKQIYQDELVDEFIFLEDLVKDKLLYKIDFQDAYLFLFPNKLIARVIVNFIFKKIKKDKKTFIHNIKDYILENPYEKEMLTIIFYAYVHSDFFEMEDFTKIFEIIFKINDEKGKFESKASILAQMYYSYINRDFKEYINLIQKQIEKSGNIQMRMEVKIKDKR